MAPLAPSPTLPLPRVPPPREARSCPRAPRVPEGCHPKDPESSSLGVLFPELLSPRCPAAALGPGGISWHSWRAPRPRPTRAVPRPCCPQGPSCSSGLAPKRPRAGYERMIPRCPARSGLEVGEAGRCCWHHRVADAVQEVLPAIEILLQVCVGQSRARGHCGSSRPGPASKRGAATGRLALCSEAVP